MFIKIVAREGEMFIEGASIVSIDIMPMCVKAQMRGGFAFPNVLILLAEYAVPEVYYVATFAIQAVEDA